jgi:hypothetical protein
VLHEGLRGDRDGVGRGTDGVALHEGLQGGRDGVGRGTYGIALHEGLTRVEEMWLGEGLTRWRLRVVKGGKNGVVRGTYGVVG